MSINAVTPELRQWIVDQARAGHPPETVLKPLLDSGWAERPPAPDDAHPARGGAPVLEGEKWVVTEWLREAPHV